ncbi:hypothetical protein [Ideonella sp.]|uniref:hypothetical protein n=1 Tax=Ideonella sp. TaxID=1929293 RepID=UPI0035B23160
MPAQAPCRLPARAALDPTGLHLGLLDIAPHELHDPFLHETVQRVPAAQTLAHVPRAELGQVQASSAPVGVIFHVARCGSTLASQLLKQLDGVVVYAEPLVINELLVPPHSVSRADLVAALRTLGGFFAAHAQRPYVLKLSSWNTLFCDLVAEAFPQTPWALCLRDPLEVCVSLLAQQPSWLRDDFATRFSPFMATGHQGLGTEARAARFFAAFCEAIMRLDQARGLLLPYESLPSAVWTSLAPHFGLHVDEPSRQRMAAAAQRHSKSQVGQALSFAPDDERKRAAASPELHRAVDEIARPAYARCMRG